MNNNEDKTAFLDNILNDIDNNEIIIKYLDDNHNECPEDQATQVIIAEYDADGNRISEIYGVINEKKK